MIESMLECIREFKTETIVTCNGGSVSGELSKNDDQGRWGVSNTHVYDGVTRSQKIIFHQDKVTEIKTTKDLTNGDLLVTIEVRGQREMKG